MKISNKYLKSIILVILVIKVFLLFWSAHPFDFWSFVNQFQKVSLFEWNFFDGWNKGNTLYVIWYPMYGLYLKIMEIFSLNFDSAILLHFFFKLPFLFIDLLTGFLIFKSIFVLTNDYKKARIGFFVWFVNPFIYIVYGVHGHYEILVSFAISLIMYGILKKEVLLIGVGIVLGFATKYFFIIFMPFIILYFLSKKEYKNIIILIAVFFVGVIFSYIHLLNNFSLLEQTFSSVIKLSQVHSSGVLTETVIPPLNIFSSVNYLFNPTDPITNLNSPSLFNLVKNGGIIFIFLILAAHLFYRCYFIFYKKKKYDVSLLITDIFISILYFLLFITNFQKHYIVWIIPILIVFLYRKIIWNWIFITVTVTGFIYAFKSEFGPRTFFLDLLTLKDPISLNSISIEGKYMMGAIIILMILLSLFLLITNKNNGNKNNEPHVLGFYFSFISVCWLLLIIINTQVILNYCLEKEKPNYLAFTGGTFHRGIIYGNYEVSRSDGKEIIFENNSINNTRVLDNLSGKISEDYFNAYIIIKNINRNNYFRRVLNSSSINGKCELTDYEGGITNYRDRSEYSGFKISVDCLEKKENKIFLKDKMQIDDGDIELFISNKEAEFLYNRKMSRFISFQSILGLLYVCGMTYGVVVLLGKIINSDKVFQKK